MPASSAKSTVSVVGTGETRAPKKLLASPFRREAKYTVRSCLVTVTVKESPAGGPSADPSTTVMRAPLVEPVVTQ